MRVIRFDDAERYEPEPDWRRVSLCSQVGISIEHFTKPPHHASPRHAHPHAQVLVVLEGRLSVVDGRGRAEVLEQGDTAYIPGDEPHVVENPLDVPSVGIDIFVPGRSFDFWKERGTAPAP